MLFMRPNMEDADVPLHPFFFLGRLSSRRQHACVVALRAQNVGSAPRIRSIAMQYGDSVSVGDRHVAAFIWPCVVGRLGPRRRRRQISDLQALQKLLAHHFDDVEDVMIALWEKPGEAFSFSDRYLHFDDVEDVMIALWEKPGEGRSCHHHHD